MRKWLKRLLRSKTLKVSTLVTALGVVQQYQDMVGDLLADRFVRTMFIVTLGIVIAVLRANTDKSLAEKADE